MWFGFRDGRRGGRGRGGSPLPLGADWSAAEKKEKRVLFEISGVHPRATWRPRGRAGRRWGLHAERLRHKLSVGFVFGLAGVAGLFARVAPVVRLGAGRVVAPRRLVEDGQALKGLAGQRLGNAEAKGGPVDTLAQLIHRQCYFG